ncbi:hypothetical protein CVT25_000808 [Psilocybe cyanescens]|uniref:Uncharacterized protein n=1 Tax=Psilocybe cyanescens TaxID=93625 RepID=A0A409W2S3_PSICY|nr:hypothetical protein CVT25_000808 [Psilocybe cyanescens]
MGCTERTRTKGQLSLQPPPSRSAMTVRPSLSLKKKALPLTPPAAACTFYLAPKMGDTVDSLAPLPITWDPSCLTTAKEIDIYLYSPGSALPRIHVWQNVALSRGTYTAELMPRWWNSSSSQSLQINVVPAGQPTFLSTLPGGPVFTATYTEPAGGTPVEADTSQVDSGITQVNDHLAKGGVSAGGKAAAVLLPLLFVALCAGAYLKMKRSRNVDKRRKWTEAVDKRMSTISTDWKSVSGAGANAAVRSSMAVGNRSSSFSFGGIRPSSTFATEGDEASAANANAAGVGLGHQEKMMAQVRTGTGVGLRNPGGLTSPSTTSVDRVSRVSFAPDTRVSRVSFADSLAPSSVAGRPSGESARNRPSRAFHSAYIPPVPALPAQESNEKEEEEEEEDNKSEEADGSFSPRQTQGALTLTPEDIRSRIAAGRARAASNAAAQQQQVQVQKQQQQHYQQQQHGHDEKAAGGGAGFDEFMPALSMMRTGNDPAAPDDLLFAASAPSSPIPTSPPPAYPKSAASTPPMASYASYASPPMQSQALPAGLSSPVMGSMPMQPMPASVMSPDEMLRAYAERKKSLAMASAGRASPSSFGSANGGRARTPSIRGAPISYPMPVAGANGSAGGNGNTTMRVLYEAATVPEVPSVNMTANTVNTADYENAHGYRNTAYTESQYAPSEYTAESHVVVGMHQHQQAQLGHHANASIGVGMYGGARYAIGADEDEDERGAVHGMGRAA